MHRVGVLAGIGHNQHPRTNSCEGQHHFQVRLLDFTLTLTNLQVFGGLWRVVPWSRPGILTLHRRQSPSRNALTSLAP